MGSNRTHVGEGETSFCPVGVSRPVDGSIRKTTSESDSWLAAIKKWPVGSRAKLRGVFPWVESYSMGVRVPLAGLTAKTAMLSCPRFEPYRYLPLGYISTSAQVL